MPGCQELSIKEMLTDPVVRVLMSADGVHADELEALLWSVANLLRARSLKDGKGLPERNEAERARPTTVICTLLLFPGDDPDRP
jgi:hypothetical protein